jgi:hypothetical protein
MKKSYLLWRGVLWVFAIYHLCVGAILFLSGDLSIKALKYFAGATIDGSPQLGVTSEILACYILAFGLMMAVAAWNPIKNRALMTIGVILIVLRVCQRLIFADKVMEVFQVPAANYWTSTSIVIVLGILIGTFRILIYRDMQGAD